jgi:hypothetical protein
LRAVAAGFALPLRGRFWEESKAMTLMSEARGEQVLRRLPPEIRSSLSDEQAQAIRRAVASVMAGRHPIDIRTTLPWPGGGLYLTVLAGREQRSFARRREERALRPLGTAGNIVFLGMLAVLLILLVGGALAIA